MVAKRARTGWTEIVESLYAGSWNPGLQRFRSPYAFRGLPRADLPLSSSLVRLAGETNVERVELALLRNFRKYAHSEGEQARSIWDWLALGQHRGLPTRLLDWTYSPLVALHFATDNVFDMNQDGVVWCVNFVEANKMLPARLKRIMQHEASETLTTDMLAPFSSLRKFDRLARAPFLVFLEPPTVDRRILNQHALFSLMSSARADMEEWLRRRPELTRRVVVPAEAKWEIRDKLDQANINERILFPDLDGLSRWLARYYLPATRPAAVVDEEDPHAPAALIHARRRDRHAGRSRGAARRRTSAARNASR